MEAIFLACGAGGPQLKRNPLGGGMVSDRRQTTTMRPRSRSPQPSRPTGAAAKAQYRVRAKVWLYPGKGGWHFANLSPKLSSEIRVRFSSEARGWGSLPVRVRIGETEWKTSLFPDAKSRSYLFAIKAAVRRSEHISAGDTITAAVTVQ